MGRKRQLTQKDLQVLSAINNAYIKRYAPPTLRDIVEYCGLHSTAHARFLVDKLYALGMIAIVNNKPIPSWAIQAIDGAAPNRREELGAASGEVST